MIRHLAIRSFDPSLRYAPRHGLKHGGRRYAPDEPLPKGTDSNMLHRLWLLEQIVPVEVVGEPPAMAVPEMMAPKVEVAEAEADPDAIKKAIGALRVDDKAAWTKAGKPQVKAIEDMLGYDITAKQRDDAWKGMSE